MAIAEDTEPQHMRMNFFDWIREGVRQSVLLGLSDAATDIGADQDVDVLNQYLAGSLQRGRIAAEPASSSGRGRRKALGRTLPQIVQDKQ